MKRIVEKHQGFPYGFPSQKIRVASREVTRFSGDEPQQRTVRFPDRLADCCFLRAEVERTVKDIVRRDSGAFQIAEPSVIQNSNPASTLPELIMIPECHSGKPVSAEAGDRFPEHHCLNSCHGGTFHHPGIAADRHLFAAERLCLAVQKDFLDAVDGVGLFTEILGEIFIQPDGHHLWSGPDEVRPAVTGPGRQVRNAVFHEYQRQTALLRP